MRPHTWYRAVLAAAAVLALAAFPAQAQQTGTVSGTVTQAGTNQPMAGVQVFVVGRAPGAVADRSSRGVLTDSDGRFTLTGVATGQVQIQARRVGFSSQTVTLSLAAGQMQDVDIQMRVSVITLDEVVVTGAGAAQSKKQLGNTIATLDASDVTEKLPVRNVSELLAAREPGVTLNVNSGVAGGSSTIEIRGTSSLSQGSAPVVYIDGVRIDGGSSLYGANTYAGSNASRARVFDNINPEAIERVEVLKGAAAATLYGSEANAGVIQVFTKKGTAGRPRFNFRIDQGFTGVDKGRLKPQTGFARDATQLANMNAIYGTSVGLFEPIQAENLANMYGTGYHYTYSGDVSGGSDDFQYFVAGRWTFDDGPVGGSSLLGGGGPILETTGEGLNDKIRRLQGSAQFTLFPRDRLSFRISTQFTDTRQESPNTDNNIYAPLTLAAFGKPERAFCQGGAAAGLGNGLCDGPGNPTGQVAFQTVREGTLHGISGNMEHFNFSATGSYQAATSLNFDLTFGIDATNQANQDFYPFAYDVDGFTGFRVDGYKSAGRRNNRELTVDGRAAWNERFGNISSALVVGGQGFISRTKTVFGDGSVFPGPGLEVVGAAANRDVSEGFEEQVNIGLLFQEQLGWNDWIYVTGGGRWDRNSAFGDQTTGQFYPKISFSIIPSDLPSWNSELFSSLRLRAAWGKSGQQPGAFDRFLTFSSITSVTGPGLQPANLGNENLRPEVSREIEVGGEVGLFGNRAAIDVTYWNRKTTDALVARQFPVSGGFTNTQLDNIGLLAAHGYEIKLNALVVDQRDLTVDFFATAAFLHEEIQSMGDAPPIKAGGTYTRYRNFLIGPDTLDVDCSAATPGSSCRGGIVYYAPGVHLGVRLIPTCDQGAVYLKGARAGQARTCWTPGSTVPYDTNGDGQPDDVGTFRSWIEANGPSLDLGDFPFNTPSSLLTDDEDDDGDLQDNYLGKPTPDWAGSFGFNATLWDNLSVNTLFEFRTGEFFVNNLTDAFRNSHPAIGRNTPRAAAMEATMLDPNTTTDQKIDAALQWATQNAALNPFMGLNTIKNAKFLRFRELGLTYTAPESWTAKFGFGSLAFNFSVRNLWLWTGYDGVDPEVNSSTTNLQGTAFHKGIEAFGAIIPRRYTLSVRFGF